MIVLDTNVLSELFRPTPSAQVVDWLALQDSAKVYFTAVGEAELRHGVALLPQGKRHDELSKAIDAILDEDFRNRVLPFDRPAAEAYALIAAERRAAGRPISQFDCQIAAIVRTYQATIATRNTADFEGCGINILNPWLP